MTFLEAAIEILRHAKEPLHFSEIAEKAVAKRLLSHVGRDPESAMRNCLTSAVRGGKADSVIVRAKPGYYAIREGAVLPESPVEEEAPPKQAKKSRSRRGRKAAPAQTELPVDDVSEEDAEQEEEEVEADEEEAESEGDDEEVESEGEEDEEEAEAEDEADEPEPEPASGGEGAPSRRKRRRRGSMGGRFGVRGEAPAPQQVAVKPSRRGSDASKRKELLQRVTPIEFEAPEGSGIEGVTDVAVVMANAMSRLAEERPELRTELELMQQQAAAAAERAVRARQQQQQQQQPEPEERSARRRRRRRRRGRRVEWTESTRADRLSGPSTTEQLLDQVARVLDEGGGRSLHIRQISENLANQGALGGEISEIERAVTASILTDIHRRGRMSRFVARGDARYQLQGSRLPAPVASAERELQAAIRSLEAEIRMQLVQWLQTLGLRGLEALARVYLEREGYTLHASLPAGRGISKLVILDPDIDDDDPRVLVLVAPKKTSVEPLSWVQDMERNGCVGIMVLWMSDENGADMWGDARVIRSEELARWLFNNDFVVRRSSFEVPVLDATVIESISGLDT